MPISISNQHSSRKIPSKTLQRDLEKIASFLGIDRHELNFLFVSDRAIRQYNKKYLNHDYATDVIAFPMKENGVLGDILVSLDTAERQAKELKHSTLREIRILMIHGLLHLLGYRDKKKSDQKVMWKKTNELLEMLEPSC